jgi:hypothetical protein
VTGSALLIPAIFREAPERQLLASGRVHGYAARMQTEPGNVDFERRLDGLIDASYKELGRQVDAIDANWWKNEAWGESKRRQRYADALEEVWRDAVSKCIAEAWQVNARGVEIKALKRRLEGRLHRWFSQFLERSRLLSKDGGAQTDRWVGINARVQALGGYADQRLRELNLGPNEGMSLGSRLSEDPVFGGDPDDRACQSSGTGEAHHLLPQNIETGPPAVEKTKLRQILQLGGDSITIGGEPLTIGGDEVRGGGHHSVRPDGPAGEMTSGEAAIATHSPSRASTWTGRRPLAEQVEVIRSYAPLALLCLDELAAAIDSRCFNDKATHEALGVLKELRASLDALISAAEGDAVLGTLWTQLEARKNDLLGLAASGAKIFVGAPVLGLAAAYSISLLTGDPVTGDMVAKMAGAGVIAEGLRRRK